MTDSHSPDGRPAVDRREQILDPAAGIDGQHADTIRDEQSTHEAGAVPAAFTGDAEPAEDTRPEESAEEPDSWDSEVHRG